MDAPADAESLDSHLPSSGDLPRRLARPGIPDLFVIREIPTQLAQEIVRAGRWSQRRDPYLLESSVPGIFACGDVRLSSVKRVAAAVGEGSMVIALVRQFLSQPQ